MTKPWPPTPAPSRQQVPGLRGLPRLFHMTDCGCNLTSLCLETEAIQPNEILIPGMTESGAVIVTERTRALTHTHTFCFVFCFLGNAEKKKVIPQCKSALTRLRMMFRIEIYDNTFW